MAQAREVGRAAPPDDGGSRGVFTRPQDETEIAPREGESTPHTAEGNSGLFFAAIAVFVLIAFAFMYALRAC